MFLTHQDFCSSECEAQNDQKYADTRGPSVSWQIQVHELEWPDLSQHRFDLDPRPQPHRVGSVVDIINKTLAANPCKSEQWKQHINAPCF